MRLHEKQLPCPESEFLSKLEAYRAAREAHRSTVDQPAPWPEHEIFRSILDRGEELVIEKDPPPDPRQLALDALAKREQERQRPLIEAAEEALLISEAAKPDAPAEVKEYVARIKSRG